MSAARKGVKSTPEAPLLDDWDQGRWTRRKAAELLEAL
jgi:hypothetical protein